MYIPLPLPHLFSRQSNPFVSPTPPSVNPSGEANDPLTTDIIVGFGVAGGVLVLLMIVLAIRHVRRKRRAKERKRLREAGLPVPPRKRRKPSLWTRMFRKKQQPRPALHIPRPSDDAVLKQPLTAHTRNKESADSTSTTAGGRKSSLDSAFAAPPVALAKNPLSMDSSWRGRIQPVPVPAPLPQQQNKLRKPRRGPVSPTLKNGQQASNVQPTLPSVAPDPLPLPLPSPAPYVSTPFVLPYREKPSSAEFPEPPPAPPLAASRGPTPEFDPLAHRSHMHRFSQLLSEPGQRLSFIFDELTRRAVQSPFSPSLPDELLVRAGEDVAVLECFDDGWSVVQRPLPAAEGGGGGGGVEQGVIPTQCWAGLPREELEPGQVPMRYSSLRHGVDQGVFEIGTAL